MKRTSRTADGKAVDMHRIEANYCNATGTAITNGKKQPCYSM